MGGINGRITRIYCNDCDIRKMDIDNPRQAVLILNPLFRFQTSSEIFMNTLRTNIFSYWYRPNARCLFVLV